MPQNLRSSEAITTSNIHYRTVRVGLSTDTSSGGTVINTPALAHKRERGLLDYYSTEISPHPANKIYVMDIT